MGGRDAESSLETTKPDPSTLELLPVEVWEVILSKLRPTDLVAVAGTSLQLAAISARLWGQCTVQLSGNDIRLALRQIKLASKLRELIIDGLSPKAAKAILSYEGPTPNLRMISLNLSALGSELGAVFLAKYGQKVERVELDLRHGPLELPRNNLALIKILPKLNVGSVVVRTDLKDDIAELSKLALKVVEIDIQRLRVGELLELYGQPDPAVGQTAAHLISRHAHHLRTLRIPRSFDEHLTAAIMKCRELRSLACNVWSMYALDKLYHVRSLQFLPAYDTTTEDIISLLACARRSKRVIPCLRELRFVNDEVCDVLLPESPPETAEAIVCTILAISRRLEILEIQWKMREKAESPWSWIRSLLSHTSLHLRELWLHGNLPPHQFFLQFAGYCPNLQILDARRTNNSKCADATGQSDTLIRRALKYLQRVHPKLTFLNDHSGGYDYDWHFYLDTEDGEFVEGPEAYAGIRPIETRAILPKYRLGSLFAHLPTYDLWFPAKGKSVSPRKHIHFWRCATLNSSVWSKRQFTEILNAAPALGLVDYREDKGLLSEVKGHEWIRDLARGPTDIRGLRIRAVLVSRHLWERIVPILRRIKVSLNRLEVDFHGRSYREWRHVLTTLGELPHLYELVLRGSFSDEKPVFDWLRGRVSSLQRLDLRDCLVVAPGAGETQKLERESGSGCGVALASQPLPPPSRSPSPSSASSTSLIADAGQPGEPDSQASLESHAAYLESLQKLLLELRGSLAGVALPPLPPNASSVLRTLGELKNLRQVALHANDLESLRPLTSLEVLELYGDQSRTNIPLDCLARSFRNIGDTLHNVTGIVLPVNLARSQLVQEAIMDVMPNLRAIHVIHEEKNLTLCAEGPKCRNFFSKLV